MSTTTAQVIILGGGLVGLSLAAALAQANIEVIVVENKQPPLRWAKDSVDARVSAINLGSQHFLNDLHVWPELDQNSYGFMRRLVIWDHLGGGEITFDCFDAGVAECGYIVENRQLIRALWQKLQESPRVQLCYPRGAHQLWRSKDQVQLILDNQDSIYAPLLVGADGGRSWVRQQMSIEVQQHDYQQQALVCVVESEHPHQDTAWQNFLPTGPIALLPLAHKHRGAIVWSLQTAEVERVLALGATAMGYELTNALNQRLGKLELKTEISAFPLVMHHAHDYVSDRLALVGDAAHSIHPLAGQGANLGLLDAACLAEVIKNALTKQHDIGSLQSLRRYQRWRKGDNLAMQIAMTGFNQLFSNSLPGLVPLRSHGLQLVNRLVFFKTWVMRYAMGTHGFNKLNDDNA